MSKMDAELKAKWVAALRSGDYKQGFGRFERGGAFCCLGVLCKVAGEKTYFQTEGSLYETDNYSFIRPLVGNAEGTLIDFNDTEEFPFSKIADWIEANL